MQRAKLRSNPPARYSVGEVIVRLPGKAQKKRHVIEAQIEKRNLKTQTYRVAFTSPVTGKREKKWLPVDDITSLTLREENINKRLLSFQKKALHRAKFKTKSDRRWSIFQVLVDKNLYQSNFQYFTVIFTFF